MYAFKYHQPKTVRQAANLLAKFPEAKVLAGGHSLIPVMKLRLASPSDIVDINNVEGLSGIEVKGRAFGGRQGRAGRHPGGASSGRRAPPHVGRARHGPARRGDACEPA